MFRGEAENTLDLSARVVEIFAVGSGPARLKAIMALKKELRGVPAAASVKIEVDYTNLGDAMLLKGLAQLKPPGSNWQIAIRATESQMKEAANVFASDVDWKEVAE